VILSRQFTVHLTRKADFSMRELDAKSKELRQLLSFRKALLNPGRRVYASIMNSCGWRFCHPSLKSPAGPFLTIDFRLSTFDFRLR
jgi:hypothetical protein